MHKEEFSTWAKNIGPFYIPEVTRDAVGNLENKIIKKFSFMENTIEIFNHWVENILDGEIRAKSIISEHGNIDFSFSRLEKPTTIVNGIEVPLYPKMCRDKSISYMGELYLNAKFTSKTSTYSSEILFGKIPILLGSKYCNLHGLTIDELIEKGEDPGDTFGYNIVKGTERVIVTQEKLRESQFFSFLHTDQEAKLEGRITCSSPSGTSVVIMDVGKKWKVLKIRTSTNTTGGKHIPLFILFLFLGIDMTDAINMILIYIPEERRDEAMIILQPSIAKSKAHYLDPVTYWRIKKEMPNHLSPTEALKIIINEINRDLFANIKASDNSPERYESHINMLKKYYSQNPNKKEFIPFQIPQIAKAKQLALMTSKMIETISAKRNFDNRDNWANKRLEASARSYEYLLVKMFDIFIAKSTADMTKLKVFEGSLVLSRISNSHNIITEQSETCFNANSWGIKGLKRQENITNLITRESPLSVISQLRKVNTPTTRKAKSEGIRALQGSQYGILCIYETPEGSNCGLVKALALTTHISIERSTESIIKLLGTLKTLFFKEQPEEGTSYPFLVNGVTKGWCYTKIVDEIVLERRKGLLPLDICIVFNKSDNVVEYYCDAARPCRPLLIMDGDELVIDKKNLWNEDLKTLFKEQAIEILDVKEIEYKYVSFTVSEIRKRKNNIIDLKKKKTNLDKKRRNNEDYLIDNESYKKHLKHFLKLKSKENIENILISFDKFPENENVQNYKEKVQLMEIENKREIIIGLNLIINHYKNLKTFENLETELKNLFNDFDYIEEELKTDLELTESLKKEIFTHCEIHPINMLGISASLIPFANNNQGARITYQASMGKQSSGHYHLNHEQRFESFKMLAKPTRPICESEVAEPVGLNIMPTGQSLTVAIYSDPDNMEDAFIGNLEFFENENFENIKWTVYKSIRKQRKDIREEFCKPPLHSGENSSRYHAIDDYGMPITGKYVKEGECVVGKIRYIAQTEDSSKKEENASLYMGVREEGYIERVLITENAEGDIIVKVKIGLLRLQMVGDKMSSRFSQKGTFGVMRAARDMIRVMSGPNKGVIPNLAINSCFTGDTPVTTYYGVSKRIDSLKYGGVWGWSESEKGITIECQHNLHTKGIRKIIQITMIDGRTVRCTPEHKILTLGEQGSKIFVEACNLMSKKVIMGPEGALDQNENIEISSGWKLKTSFLSFTVENRAKREQTLCFIRLLGYYLEQSEKKSTGEIFVDNIVDLEIIERDIYFLTEKHVTVLKHTKISVFLPQELLLIMNDIKTFGKIPCFILSTTCPTSVVREYLAGVMGTCGSFSNVYEKINANFGNHVILKQHHEDRNILQSNIVIFDSLIRKMGVKTQMNLGYININSIDFVEKIGFRYNTNNMQKLSIISSYCRFINFTVNGNDNKNFSFANYTNWKHTQKLLDVNYSLNFTNYLFMIGGVEAFNGIVHKDSDKPVLSNFFMDVKEIEELEVEEEVFDITVHKNHTFFANGLAVSNCGQPSRMTLGKIKEILASKGFLYDFRRVNGTTFGNDNIDNYMDVLEENGMDRYGNEEMCLPNGKPLSGPVFFGVCFYQSLRHHVQDKIQIRARGEIRPISRQPVGGRAKKGGLRIGEMERDALIASGCSSILNERLMVVSDKYRTVFCSTCGTIAVSDNQSHKKNKNSCGFCNKNAEFGLLTIPYIYKLIYHMLIGVGINIKHGLKYKIEQGESLMAKVLA